MHCLLSYMFSSQNKGLTRYARTTVTWLLHASVGSCEPTGWWKGFRFKMERHKFLDSLISSYAWWNAQNHLIYLISLESACLNFPFVKELSSLFFKMCKVLTISKLFKLDTYLQNQLYIYIYNIAHCILLESCLSIQHDCFRTNLKPNLRMSQSDSSICHSAYWAWHGKRCFKRNKKMWHLPKKPLSIRS